MALETGDRPLGDRGEIAGLDQFVRLEAGEGARTGGGQAHRGRGPADVRKPAQAVGALIGGVEAEMDQRVDAVAQVLDVGAVLGDGQLARRPLARSRYLTSAASSTRSSYSGVK